MNYIKLLHGALTKFYHDDRPAAIHLSLYVALFQLWNANRFNPEFRIVRREVMQLSKIGSHSAYHRAIRALDKWGYIRYYASKNAFEGSRIKMKSLIALEENIEEKKVGYPKTGNEQASGFPNPSGTALALHTPEYARELEVRYTEIESEPVQTNPDLSRNEGCTSPESEQAVGSIYKPNKHKPIKQQITLIPKNEFEVKEFFKINKGEVADALYFFSYYQDKDWHTAKGEKITDWKSLASWWIKNSKKRTSSRPTQDDHLKTAKIKNYAQPL
ncbi:hypothetical protein ACW6QP_14535 [Salegentibacter sp. HM20]